MRLPQLKPFAQEKESAELLDSYLDGLSAVDATDAMVEVSFDTENGRKVALPRDIKSRSERRGWGMPGIHAKRALF